MEFNKLLVVRRYFLRDTVKTRRREVEFYLAEGDKITQRLVN